MQIRCQKCRRILTDDEQEKTTIIDGLEYCEGCSKNASERIYATKNNFKGMTGILPSEPETYTP